MLMGPSFFRARPLPSTSTSLLLDLGLPGPSRRAIALAETFAAPTIASLDEAGGQVAAPAVAADEFLRF